MSPKMSTPEGGQRILPTERLIPRRQLEELDLVAELGGTERLPVPAADISARMSVSIDTVTAAQGFLRQNGLFVPDRGVLAVTPEGLRLAELRAADSARARLFLKQHWRSAWFTTAAARLLTQGPLDSAELARRIGHGLSRTAERARHLVEWLDYALIVHCDQHEQVRLTDGFGRAAHASTPPPTSAPVFASGQEISALSDERFFSMMQAYRTVLTSLAPASPTGGTEQSHTPPM
ncbi:hypothetical protein [Streptomyces sp. WM6378]|uniref:hypothetical protein n=1 Tax=Streptomyces sp. WM6378 TaxID=1415557 RepID=UPI0006C637E8|nr:hypothetical protein [Streptomyces sp. WM6378]KOU40669.1 hypothetical protein ADK54_21470 [Streptomyces sp. WM6378]